MSEPRRRVGSITLRLLLVALVIVGGLNLYVMTRGDEVQYFETASGTIFKQDDTGTFEKIQKGWEPVPRTRLPSLEPASQSSGDAPITGRWHVDADGDGHGDWYRFVDAPEQPAGFVANATDCDDGNRSIHEGPATMDKDYADFNCDGRYGGPRRTSNAGLISDACADGPTRGHDCDGDGVDNVVFNGTDCDDTNAQMYPGYREQRYDNYDNDCDIATADTGYDRPYDPERFVALHINPSRDPRFKG